MWNTSKYSNLSIWTIFFQLAAWFVLITSMSQNQFSNLIKYPKLLNTYLKTLRFLWWIYIYFIFSERLISVVIISVNLFSADQLGNPYSCPLTGVWLAGGTASGRGSERWRVESSEREREDPVRWVGEGDGHTRTGGGCGALWLWPGHQPGGRHTELLGQLPLS